MAISNRALPAPNPPTAIAGTKILASDWNSAVRDAVLYLLELQGGAGRRNLLINGSFDIWQSGTSFPFVSSPGAWTVDQWYAQRRDSGNLSVGQLGFGDSPDNSFYGVKITNQEAQFGGTTEFLQPIETQNAILAAGRSVSLRVRANKGSGFGAGQVDAILQVLCGTGSDENVINGYTNLSTPLNVEHEFSTEVDTYTFDNIEIPADTREIAVRFAWDTPGRSSADDSLSIFDVQLSIGAAAVFENVPMETIYAECQRHYQAGEIVTTTGYTVSGALVSETQVLPTTMRTTPTYAFVANLTNLSFPATSSTPTTHANTPRTITRYRTANATAAGYWGESYTLDARLI